MRMMGTAFATGQGGAMADEVRAFLVTQALLIDSSESH